MMKVTMLYPAIKGPFVNSYKIENLQNCISLFHEDLFYKY